MAAGAAGVVAVAAVAAMAADKGRGAGGTDTSWAYSPTVCTTRTPAGWRSTARRGSQPAAGCATTTPPMAMTAAGRVAAASARAAAARQGQPAEAYGTNGGGPWRRQPQAAVLAAPGDPRCSTSETVGAGGLFLVSDEV